MQNVNKISRPVKNSSRPPVVVDRIKRKHRSSHRKSACASRTRRQAPTPAEVSCARVSACYEMTILTCCLAVYLHIMKHVKFEKFGYLLMIVSKSFDEMYLFYHKFTQFFHWFCFITMFTTYRWISTTLWSRRSCKQDRVGVLVETDD